MGSRPRRADYVDKGYARCHGRRDAASSHVANEARAFGRERVGRRRREGDVRRRPGNWTWRGPRRGLPSGGSRRGWREDRLDIYDCIEARILLVAP